MRVTHGPLAVCAAIFGLLTIRGTGEYRRWYTLVFSAFLGTVCGILAYETPFNLIQETIRDGIVHVPPTGTGMTPSLQNYWVVIHPPTIFLGFGSLTVFFAYAVAAVVLGAGQLACAIAFAWKRDDVTARRLLRASLIYLPLLLGCLVALPGR